MKEYIVKCYTSEEVIVRAENKEDAERIAVDECNFAYVDYCEVDET